MKVCIKDFEVLLAMHDCQNSEQLRAPGIFKYGWNPLMEHYCGKVYNTYRPLYKPIDIDGFSWHTDYVIILED